MKKKEKQEIIVNAVMILNKKTWILQGLNCDLQIKASSREKAFEKFRDNVRDNVVLESTNPLNKYKEAHTRFWMMFQRANKRCTAELPLTKDSDILFNVKLYEGG